MVAARAARIMAGARITPEPAAPPRPTAASGTTVATRGATNSGLGVLHSTRAPLHGNGTRLTVVRGSKRRRSVLGRDRSGRGRDGRLL